MMEEPKEIVILGKEEYTVNVCNTYIAATLGITMETKDNAIVWLEHGEDIADITKDCRMIRIIDRISHRYTRREIYVKVERSELYGVYKLGASRYMEKPYIEKVCKDYLHIPFSYEAVKEVNESHQERARRVSR